MPTYSYHCLNGHKFESRQPVNAAIVNCPECGELANREAVNKPFLRTETGVKPQYQEL